MIARDLISESIIPVRSSDTGNSALLVMQDFNVHHLPVVNNEELLGVVSEETILNHPLTDAIGSMQLMEGSMSAQEDDHIFEIMRLMVRQELTTIPVTDSERRYMGTISHMDLLKYFAQSYSLAELGATILIEIKPEDYSLAEITRVVEGEGGRILCAFASADENVEKLQISLKISSEDSERIIKTLERVGFNVKANFNHEEEYDDLYSDRYHSLLHYLNM